MVMLFGGLGLCLMAIVVATVIDGNSFGPLIGPSSLVLVMFGAIGASVMSFELSDVLRLPKALIYALTGKPADPDGTITKLAALADVARREGMLALEGKLADLDDAFLRGGMQLIVDGLDAEQVRDQLEIDTNALDERHQTMIKLLKAMGAYAPTFGMLGTVIGLINMLGNLTDPSGLGLGMSLALLTTLYGVAFANLLFLPLAGKLERLNGLELIAREVTVDGLLALQAGASPRLLVERLETFLPVDRRVGLKARTDAPAPAVAKAA